MRIFILIAAVFAAMAIYFQQHDRSQLWILKPLPIIVMMCWLWFRGLPSTDRTLILLGLFFSMIGDLFLIIPQQYFIHGLSSFFIAHVFYIVAFYKRKKTLNLKSFVSYLIGLGIYASVSTGVSSDLKIPVIAYTLAISTMLGLAFNVWLSDKNSKAKWALIGAFLFVISDTLIAVNKFSYRSFYIAIWILPLYYMAQGFITASVLTRKKIN